MRIAVISDTHGNLPALNAVLTDVQAQAVDQLVCLGDLALKGPSPGECIRRVRELGIPCLHGNTDLYLLEASPLACGRPLKYGPATHPSAIPLYEWHLARIASAELEYLAALPFEHRVSDAGTEILFVHANPRDTETMLRPLQPPEEADALLEGVRADWIVMGHIHRPFQFRHAGHLLVNAGAVGFSFDGDWRPSYAVLDTAGRSVTLHRVEYDVDETLQLAAEQDFPVPPDRLREQLLARAR